MTEAYRSAERIVVFSGDFSFLREDEFLHKMFSSLNGENKITLISSKSEVSVKRQMGMNESTAILFNDLLTAKNIVFDSGINIKLSLIDDHRRYSILYKYPTSSGHNMCTLRSTDESYYLLEAISDFINKVVTQLKNC